MFNDLIRRMTDPAPDTLPDPDARLALGALLVRVARSDNDYADAEIAQIDRVLGKRYDLSPFEAAKLRGECETLEAQAPDTVRFTRAIKDAVVYEDRLAVIKAMWSVVLADGVREDEEDSLMRVVASLLGVSDQDSHAARRSLT
ncbi:TerB family tellurite resistance protein [Loktanella agnita]|uniref:tellurite resistance TerB family protein n=1 Tax=Loktanella agnita TaxID=287097 RepID=UPI003988D90E